MCNCEFITEQNEVEISQRLQVLENGDLLISSVRESDAGWYTCFRANEAGQVKGSAYLGVLGMLFSVFHVHIYSGLLFVCTV